MLDLILKILLFAAMAYAAFSIIRMYVRRLARRIRKLNYDTVGAKAHIPLVGFLLSVVFSILSIYELFIEERAKYYRDMCFCANCVIIELSYSSGQPAHVHSYD